MNRLRPTLPMARTAGRWLPIAALWALGSAACSSPEPPVFGGAPPPTPAADVLCQAPGFPRDVGQAWFRLVDMDQGKSCTVFVEQDDCVLAIFRDCTDASTNPREWQGVASVPQNIELRPVYPQGSVGVIIPRSPACCQGTVVPPTGVTRAARLDCRLDSCEAANRFHTGLFLTRNTEDTPAFTAGNAESVAALDAPADAVSAVWDAARGEGWLGWSNGLYVRSLGGGTETVDETLPAAQLAQDPDTVFVAGGRSLARVDKATRAVDVRAELSGDALALARTPAGVLVAVRDDDGTVLQLNDPQNLVLRSTRAYDGVATGLASRPEASETLLTIDDPPRLVLVSAALAPVRTARMEDFTDLAVADVVPASPRWLSDTRVAFAGECYRGAGKVHCYYEHSIAEETNSASPRTERIGIPDEVRLTDLRVRGDTDVWIGGANGAVHRIRRNPVEPRPSERTLLDHDVAAIVDTGEALWALSASTGELTVLEPAR